MNLNQVQEGKEYIVKTIKSGDEELEAFLFSLGCYSGEPITVINKMKSACIVIIKNARYSIDKNLAMHVKI